MSVKDIPIDDLEPDPFNEELLPTDEPSERFVGDIGKKGIEERLKVTPAPDDAEAEYHVIDGKRRWKAAKLLNRETVPCEVREFEDEETKQIAILALNDHRDETFTQKVKMALKYEELVASYYEERMKAGKSLKEIHDPDEADPLSDMTEEGWDRQLPEKETRRAYAADRVGWSTGKFNQAKNIWKAKTGTHDIDDEKASQRIQEIAEEQVELLDAGEQSVYGAFKELKRWKSCVEEGYPVPWGSIQESVSYAPGSARLEHFEDKKNQLSADEPWEENVRSMIESYNDQKRDRDQNIVSDAFVFSYLFEKEFLDEQDEAPGLVDAKPDAETLHELYWEKDMKLLHMSVALRAHPHLVRCWMCEEEIPLKLGDVGKTSKLRGHVPDSYYEYGFSGPDEKLYTPSDGDSDDPTPDDRDEGEEETERAAATDGGENPDWTGGLDD